MKIKTPETWWNEFSNLKVFLLLASNIAQTALNIQSKLTRITVRQRTEKKGFEVWFNYFTTAIPIHHSRSCEVFNWKMLFVRSNKKCKSHDPKAERVSRKSFSRFVGHKKQKRWKIKLFLELSNGGKVPHSREPFAMLCDRAVYGSQAIK